MEYEDGTECALCGKYCVGGGCLDDEIPDIEFADDDKDTRYENMCVKCGNPQGMFCTCYY